MISEYVISLLGWCMETTFIFSWDKNFLRKTKKCCVAKTQRRASQGPISVAKTQRWAHRGDTKNTESLCNTCLLWHKMHLLSWNVIHVSEPPETRPPGASRAWAYPGFYYGGAIEHDGLKMTCWDVHMWYHKGMHFFASKGTYSAPKSAFFGT